MLGFVPQPNLLFLTQQSAGNLKIEDQIGYFAQFYPSSKGARRPYCLK